MELNPLKEIKLPTSGIKCYISLSYGDQTNLQKMRLKSKNSDEAKTEIDIDNDRQWQLGMIKLALKQWSYKEDITDEVLDKLNMNDFLYLVNAITSLINPEKDFLEEDRNISDV